MQKKSSQSTSKSFVAVREVGRASSLMMDPWIVGGKGSVADAGDAWGDHRVVSL
ncbi:hypothetical protein QJS04_geneDACA020753 [Acorus gramineus]|uniref:Uncharacterized protein n=1 Tax=Acorus gramineus TaxID=55184 RepID=A0AAV9A5Y9_ACOGR|nr:hypothetical protein QJS04_geneDACA020753 [Acorus gramineus]